MSNEVLTKSIEVLEDGKIKAITTLNNEVVYLQPIIVVDSKEANQRLEVKGSNNNQIRVSTDIETINDVIFSGSFSALETAIREAAKTANGLRVGGASSGGDVTFLVDNAKLKEQQFYFNFDDIEKKTESLTFPLTGNIASHDGVTIETVPSATYADLDALIAAFNSGITHYIIEKRTETSFYVLDNASTVTTNQEDKQISFNNSIFNIRIYQFFTLNQGGYPIDDLGVNDELLEQQKRQIGTGLFSSKIHVNPQGEVFYNVKSFELEEEVMDADNQIKIELLNEGLDNFTIPYTKANGQRVTGWKLPTGSVQKTPIKVTNLGAITNSVTITATY